MSVAIIMSTLQLVCCLVQVRACVCVNVLLSLRDKSIPGFEPKPALWLDPVKVEVGVRVSQSWGS